MNGWCGVRSYREIFRYSVLLSAACISTATPVAAELKASAGTALTIQAVKDDKLNLRANASGTSPILVEVPPNATGLVATGRAKNNGSDTWVEVRFGPRVGWVHSNFVRVAKIPKSPSLHNQRPRPPNSLSLLILWPTITATSRPKDWWAVAHCCNKRT